MAIERRDVKLTKTYPGRYDVAVRATGEKLGIVLKGDAPSGYWGSWGSWVPGVHGRRMGFSSREEAVMAIIGEANRKGEHAPGRQAALDKVVAAYRALKAAEAAYDGAVAEAQRAGISAMEIATASTVERGA